MEPGIGFAIASDPYQYEDLSHYKGFYKDSALSDSLNDAAVYPFLYKPDYGLYHLICLEKTGQYYKILVNDSTSAFIANDTNFYFQSWESMLIGSGLRVTRKTKDNPILSDWKGSARIIHCHCENEVLHVEDVIESQGDFWMNVSFSPTCEYHIEKNTKRRHGWFKWRTKDELLIKLLPLW